MGFGATNGRSASRLTVAAGTPRSARGRHNLLLGGHTVDLNQWPAGGKGPKARKSAWDATTTERAFLDLAAQLDETTCKNGLT